ncbi:hypothetical protein WN66_03709 [Saccharomyces cerevisiae]|uniref:EC1118_1J19_0804p n=1 Tax=Saccharomyces cerevisiae (strain Lalvin EC1118 / Prise de mousse) TaxID=643680 RepID=C8ZBS6_YEAS8|nr:hypothetical protein WN66_03709 [Saccharomyces cerevisiae]CAY80842.1 EC1118_1J19_0804p [Saccharomyces cerevisiae EC1118]
MQGQAGKRKTDGKVPSNTEQNCPDLFERPRFVCIMQAPLVQMRTVPSETGHFPKVISLNGSCSRSYLLSMPHTQLPYPLPYGEFPRCSTVRRDHNFPCTLYSAPGVVHPRLCVFSCMMI